MNRIATVCQLLNRILAPVMIVLGLLFWTGNALTLIPAHMLLGLLVVLLLWLLAALAAVARVSWTMVVLGAVWGIVVLALGVTQTQLVPGDLHWVIRLLHLVAGLGALALIERLARRIKLAPPSSSPEPVPAA